jgi:D-glycero-alpha-D-manno-heptose-7-phosphate kinase
VTFAHLVDVQIPAETDLRSVLDRFAQTALFTGGVGFAVVIDAQSRCVGVVTDGDIRQALLADVSLDDPITEVMTAPFVFAEIDYSRHQVLRLFDQRIRHVPVLDQDRRLVDLLLSSSLNTSIESTEKVIRSRAPVRVSFAGGGTDMSFYFSEKCGLVLSSTINKYCYASVSVRSDSRIVLKSREFEQSVEAASVDDLHYDGTLDLLKACVKVMRPTFGFDLETYSEIEPGTGLGGSAAISCAVIGAFNHFRNQNQLNQYDLADLAYQAERVELGIEGGWQDQYSSTFGGMNLIEFREDAIVVNPLRVQESVLLELHLNLLLFRIGGIRESGKIVEVQREGFQENLEMRHHYDQMRSLAQEMKDHLLRGELCRFGHSLDTAWKLKRRFADGISNRSTDELYAEAKACGAIGGKLLGAGGSGYLMLFSPPEQQAEIVRRLAAKGVEQETFDFVDHGVQIWSAEKRSNSPTEAEY